MIIILLFLACIGTLRGTPLSTQLESQTEIFVPSTRDIPRAPYGQRTVNGIVISCFATIFACTWSAIHPNIPSPMDCGWTRLKRQFLTMLCALLAPELITAWALRQYWAAKDLAQSYNRDMSDYITTDVTSSRFFQDSAFPNCQNGKGSRWTLTHGFFLQMGGFMLCEDGKPVQTLRGGNSPRGIIYYIRNGTILPPKITKDDIQDRSKGDTISKALIILQTTWFAVQCIARWSQRLPVTELEVVTLAYALLNGITYALWWKKPQNVGRPVFLEAQKLLNEECGSDSSSISYNTGSQVQNMLHAIPRAPPWRIPLKLLGILIRPLGKLFSDVYEQMKSDHQFRVGMFYSYAPNRSWWGGIKTASATFAVAVIGTVFGCVHLIPSWVLDFPSRREMLLWRISAIIITVEPIWLAALIPIFSAHRAMIYQTTPLFSLYMIARIIILVLSLISLRSLPSPALETIEWTTYIPHL